MGILQSTLTASQTSLTGLRSGFSAAEVTLANTIRSRLTSIFSMLPANDVFTSKASAQVCALSIYTLLNGGELDQLQARHEPPTGPYQPRVVNPPIYNTVCARLDTIMASARAQS